MTSMWTVLMSGGCVFVSNGYWARCKWNWNVSRETFMQLNLSLYQKNWVAEDWASAVNRVRDLSRVSLCSTWNIFYLVSRDLKMDNVHYCKDVESTWWTSSKDGFLDLARVLSRAKRELKYWCSQCFWVVLRVFYKELRWGVCSAWNILTGGTKREIAEVITFRLSFGNNCFTFGIMNCSTGNIKTPPDSSLVDADL